MDKVLSLVTGNDIPTLRARHVGDTNVQRPNTRIYGVPSNRAAFFSHQCLYIAFQWTHDSLLPGSQSTDTTVYTPLGVLEGDPVQKRAVEHYKNDEMVNNFEDVRHQNKTGKSHWASYAV
jgi:hypothetical protein